MPQFFPTQFMLDFDHLHDREVDHVIGAFFLVRQELFKTLHGFDERFFVYLEDMDFSLRSAQQGWRTWYMAAAQAFHKGGGVSEQVRAHRLFYSLRSRLLYSFKHFARRQAFLITGLTLSIEFVARLGHAILQRSPTAIWDTLRGYGMLWADIPRLIRER